MIQIISKDHLFAMHDDLCSKAKKIMEKKNKDYSGGVPDVFANFRGSAIYGVEPEIGIMIRIQDKFKRIETFIRKGVLAVENENCNDTLRDIINYTVLLAGMLEERKIVQSFTKAGDIPTCPVCSDCGTILPFDSNKCSYCGTLNYTEADKVKK